jgi:hypothetical protein
LPAEVAYDAIQQVSAAPADMSKAIEDPMPRAIALGNTFARNGNAKNNYALTVFGRPARLTNCDCERSNEASLLQTIYLRNDQEMLGSIERSGWLRQMERELSPKTAATGNPGDSKQLEVALAKARRQLERVKEKNPGNAKLIAQAEKRVRELEAKQPVEQTPAETPPPAAAAAPMPTELATQLIRETYLRTVSRPPTDSELARSQEYLATASTPMAGVRDLLWALLNTKEFIVNH